MVRSRMIHQASARSASRGRLATGPAMGVQSARAEGTSTITRRHTCLSLLAVAALAACDSARNEASGGALVDFSICAGSAGGAQTLTIFTVDDAFIEEASRLLATGQTRIPVFDLVDGAGADPQWSWHVDPATPVFADVAIELCDGCPRDVESNKPYWLGTVKRYCPWSAAVSAVTRTP